ncbi:MAG: hypothetical protein N2C14_30250 [Planctomycetales bacterium]
MSLRIRIACALALAATVSPAICLAQDLRDWDANNWTDSLVRPADIRPASTRSRTGWTDYKTTDPCDPCDVSSAPQPSPEDYPAPAAPERPFDPSEQMQPPAPEPSYDPVPQIDLSESYSAVSSDTYAATDAPPNMIGDFFGGNSSRTVISMSNTVSQQFMGALVANVIGPDSYQIQTGVGGTSFFATNTAFPIQTLMSGDVVPLDATQQDFPNTTTAGTFTIIDPRFPDGNLNATVSQTFVQQIVIHTPSPSLGVVGLQKIAENGNAIPQDRVFLNYSYFDDTILSRADGVDVSRFTPGFEKTFFGGGASVEVRVPMAARTLSSDLETIGALNVDAYEFGNLWGALKALFWRNDMVALAGGVSVHVPTADDIRVYNGGAELARVTNQAVHIQPYFAAVLTPNSRFFFQSFLQVDVSANGNPVSVLDPVSCDLQEVGTWNDPTMLFCDCSLGYWFYQPTNNYRRRITGAAVMGEFHYNTTLQDEDFVVGNGFAIGNFAESVEVLNFTGGLLVELNQRTTLTVGYATPIGNSADRQFDGEVRAMLNHNFGPNGVVPGPGRGF